MSPRRCEIQTPDGWREVAFSTLTPGALFRLFDAVTGAPIEDEDGVTRWRALAVPVGDKVEAEQVPESDVERQVRVGGVFWPSSHGREGLAPRRLR